MSRDDNIRQRVRCFGAREGVKRHEKNHTTTIASQAWHDGPKAYLIGICNCKGIWAHCADNEKASYPFDSPDKFATPSRRCLRTPGCTRGGKRGEGTSQDNPRIRLGGPNNIDSEGSEHSSQEF